MRTGGFRAALMVVGLMLVPGLAAAQVADGQAQDQAQVRQQRRQARRVRLQQRFQARFQQLDKNGDGVISRDEWTRRPETFDRIDVNHDGVLSQDELKTAVARAVRRHLRRR